MHQATNPANDPNSLGSREASAAEEQRETLPQAASRDEILEHVSCAVCGSGGQDVVFEARYQNERDLDLIQKFRASGDELLIDRLVKCRDCGLQYISPRLRSDLDPGELRGG